MKLVIANFKMNGDKQFYLQFIKQINKVKLMDTKVVLCPPFVYLPTIKAGKFELGAQNVSGQAVGNKTGEISAKMLKEFGVEYCIVGHSENRLTENWSEIIKKCEQCLKLEITPILCICKTDVDSLNSNISKIKSKGQIVLAFEPVESIGSGIIKNIEELAEIIEKIRKNVAKINREFKIIYGGSVCEHNLKLLNKLNVDGFIVGNSALDFEKFKKIIQG